MFDVNAPDTSWRGTEDPIPVLLGRYPLTAAAYRFVACRPMDGRARTDATFWRPGTRAYTQSGRTMPYQYWPGWKRGLLLTRAPLVPGAYTAAVTANGWLEFNDGWRWEWPGPTLAWSPWMLYAGVQGTRYALNYRHERNYLRPIRQAAYGVLRTRDGVAVDIPRGMVRGRDNASTGRLFLPPAWAGSDGDRDNLLELVRGRLAAPTVDARWNMEGARPHMELFIPAQPPTRVSWERMISQADPVSPYLGESASGPVSWDLGDDSPHAGVLGGSGSGKSELMAWIVAQFMRGGAGIIVLDPKYASQRWLIGAPGVLYCTEPQALHDTILWLDEELRRRGRESQRTEEVPPRLVVVLEERNSMQSTLRELWAATRPRGAPTRSPALAALDRLASQGRSLGINVLLAAQEGAQVDIGSRSSYGAFAVAGRMKDSVWRLIQGSGSRKPAISTKPGRFGWVVGGATQVFQAAFPDLKKHGARLLDFALSGDAPLNVTELMQQQYTASYPSSQGAATEDATVEYVTLRQYADSRGIGLTALRSRVERAKDAPPVVGTGSNNANLFERSALDAWRGSDTREKVG